MSREGRPPPGSPSPPVAPPTGLSRAQANYRAGEPKSSPKVRALMPTPLPPCIGWVKLWVLGRLCTRRRLVTLLTLPTRRPCRKVVVICRNIGVDRSALFCFKQGTFSVL